MHLVAAILSLYAALLATDNEPKTMRKLVVRRASNDAPRAASLQSRKIYRAGERYCRIEDEPDLENWAHTLLIVNGADAWTVNRLAKTALHAVDATPAYRCGIFADNFAGLEFGRELEYFRSKSATPRPGPNIMGKPTQMYAFAAGDSLVYLFMGGEPEVPVAISRTRGQKQETVWFMEYDELPFEAKLFSKPDGIVIEEAK